MRFEDIPGLFEEKSKLLAAVHNNHIAHAQLFHGPEGSACLAMALAFVTYINCDKPGDTDSCGACPSCSKMSKLVHPDVNFAFPIAEIPSIELKDRVCKNYLKWWRPFASETPYGNLADWNSFFGAESKLSQIYRQESREIISALSLKAFEGKYKAMLIWLPEKMNPAAANALLKIVEEPPENTFFFFVSNDYEAIINTIISRTRLISIRAFTDDEVARYLADKKGVAAERAKQIARLAGGNLGLALKLLDEVQDGSVAVFRDWMRTCWAVDYDEMVAFMDRFNTMSKMAQRSLMEYGLTVLRESLVVNANESSLLRVTAEEEAFVTKFSKTMSMEKIEKMSAYLNDTIYHLERNANPRILFLDLSIQLAVLLRSGVTQQA